MQPELEHQRSGGYCGTERGSWQGRAENQEEMFPEQVEGHHLDWDIKQGQRTEKDCVLGVIVYLNKVASVERWWEF